MKREKVLFIKIEIEIKRVLLIGNKFKYLWNTYVLPSSNAKYQKVFTTNLDTIEIYGKFHDEKAYREHIAKEEKIVYDRKQARATMMSTVTIDNTIDSLNKINNYDSIKALGIIKRYCQKVNITYETLMDSKVWKLSNGVIVEYKNFKFC